MAGRYSPPQLAFCTPSPSLTLLSWISMRTWCCRPLPPCERQEFWGRLGPEQREGEPRGPVRPTLALGRTGDRLTQRNTLFSPPPPTAGLLAGCGRPSSGSWVG